MLFTKFIRGMAAGALALAALGAHAHTVQNTPLEKIDFQSEVCPLAQEAQVLDVPEENAFSYGDCASGTTINPYKFVDPDGRAAEAIPLLVLAGGVAVCGAIPSCSKGMQDAIRSTGRLIENITRSDSAEVPKAEPKKDGDQMSSRPSDSDGKRGSTGGPGEGKRFGSETPEEKADKEGVPCQYCGRGTTNEPGKENSRERDHIDPKSRGGNNSSENERDSCRTCSRGKSNRNPDEWKPKPPEVQ